MVTIEQKVLLFSKLIDQLMNSQFTEGLKNLEAEYSVKLEKNRKSTDLEVNKILSNAKKKRDLEISKAYSNFKINEKKEYMLVKENCYNKFMVSLKSYIDDFIKSDKYKDYLLKLINDINLEKNHISNMIIYMTNNDYNRFSELISMQLKSLGYNDDSYKIVVAKDNIIGGIIVENNVDKFRLNLSIKAVLEDNKPYIMQMLFEALEAGVDNE